jgi:hypothetical protein
MPSLISIYSPYSPSTRWRGFKIRAIWWLNSEVVEALIEDSNSKEKYYLTIDTNDYSIQKVTKNNLTNEIDNKYNNTTIRIDGKKVEFDGYLQGALLEFEYKKIGDKYHLHRLYHKGKGILVSTDGALKHQFISEQLYLNTQVLKTCNEKLPNIKLKKCKSLRKINTKYNKEDWSRLNTILPLKEQKLILDARGRAK